MADDCPAGAPLWMVTFADLMSLLLTLFVLLLTFAEMDIVKYESVIGSLQNALGTSRESKLKGVIEIDGSLQRKSAQDVDLSKLPEEIRDKVADAADIPKPAAEMTPEELAEAAKLKREGEAEDLKQEIEAKLAEQQNTEKVAVERIDGEVVLRFPSEIAFPSGGGDISDEFRDIIDSITPVIADTKGTIVVSGHTDNVPIAGGRFRSNWDLSAARSASVMLRILETSDLNPERVTLQGFGDSRPLASNDTPEGRAKNRRVEVSIIQDQGTKDGDAAEPAKPETPPDGAPTPIFQNRSAN